METQPEEKKSPAEETGAPPAETAPPPEEPILLNQLLPEAQRDLDALFPDPGMKKLIKDIVRTRQKNERFLKRITQKDLPPEENGEETGEP